MYYFKILFRSEKKNDARQRYIRSKSQVEKYLDIQCDLSVSWSTVEVPSKRGLRNKGKRHSEVQNNFPQAMKGMEARAKGSQLKQGMASINQKQNAFMNASLTNALQIERPADDPHEILLKKCTRMTCIQRY